ncbi:ABC transporter substrate-binding protein [Rhizobium sp. XQZ8]|uniref:ABC transporter substrate-binding protein n=1 Tax=Rhizobium populisoli TaxID=2859785 RepID=UPI001CA5295D|nr:ABC transporter substrate-binding protein [Rhizobium populisoli]MBW6421487.1 ABC transporter substrate-binding protein [Rhizobium populisoli]
MSALVHRVWEAVTGPFLLALYLIVALAGTIASATAQEKITVTDLAGRTVQVPHGAKKVILGEGRMFYATVVFDKDKPFEQLAAIGDDLPKFDPDTWSKYLARFPDAKNVPMIGAAASADFSVEKALQLDVDVLVVTLGFYDKIKESGIIDKLEKAGVPTVFVDFRERPTQNTVPSILLLGRIFGKEAQAQAFADYYMAQMRRVYMGISSLKANERPVVFAERAAGLDPAVCCDTFGNFNFGEFIAEAGGFNLGTKYVTGVSGRLNPEAVIVENPPFIVVTGANWSKSNPGNKGVWLGYEMSEEAANKQLQGLMERTGFPELKAVKDKNVMAVYHQFYQSPYHFVAVQALAKWLHPQRFKDLDPQATFKELHQKFLPIDVSGVFWTTLK